MSTIARADPDISNIYVNINKKRKYEKEFLTTTGHLALPVVGMEISRESRNETSFG